MPPFSSLTCRFPIQSSECSTVSPSRGRNSRSSSWTRSSLKRAKQGMRKDLEIAIDTFNSRVSKFREDIVKELPLSGDMSTEEGL